MASILKVSESAWVKKGLAAAAHKKILEQGYGIRWKGNGFWTIFSPVSELDFGTVHVSSDTLTPDHIFSAKFKELTGLDFADIKTADATPTTAKPIKSFVIPPGGVQQVPNTAKAPKADTLASAEKVGKSVHGTSSSYTVLLITPYCKLGYHRNNGALSMRAEAFDETARKALVSFGFSSKKTDDGRPYCALHVSAPGDLARRTIGAVLGTILRDTPDQVLPLATIA